MRRVGGFAIRLVFKGDKKDARDPVFDEPGTKRLSLFNRHLGFTEGDGLAPPQCHSR